MRKGQGERLKVSVPMIIIDDFEGARFEQPLGNFDVKQLDDGKGVITQDEIKKDILLALPDGAAVRIPLADLGAAVVKSWGQWKVKKCVRARS